MDDKPLISEVGVNNKNLRDRLYHSYALYDTAELSNILIELYHERKKKSPDEPIAKARAKICDYLFTFSAAVDIWTKMTYRWHSMNPDYEMSPAMSEEMFAKSLENAHLVANHMQISPVRNFFKTATSYIKDEAVKCVYIEGIQREWTTDAKDELFRTYSSERMRLASAQKAVLQNKSSP